MANHTDLDSLPFDYMLTEIELIAISIHDDHALITLNDSEKFYTIRLNVADGKLVHTSEVDDL